MKLITWNIQWGCGMDGRVDLARIVRRARDIADFDVLNVQEVADNFPALAGNDDRDQFAELSKLLPGFARAEAYGVDVPGEDGRRRRFGNAIFTRYAILGVRRHNLPWPPHPGKKSMQRVAVEATLQAPMGPVRVTTAHLEYYSDVQRRAQVARLRNLHDEACQRVAAAGETGARTGGPFDPLPQTLDAILTGDFNFPADNAAYGDLQAPLAGNGPRYRDAWPLVHRHQPHAPTFCVHSDRYSKTPYCCDFVFVSDTLAERVRRIEVDSGAKESDHQPVLAEIDDY